MGLALVLASAGCGAPASVALGVSLADGPPPTMLTVSVFGPYGTLARGVNVIAPHLPGRLLLYNVATQPLRVAAVADGGREGFATLTAQAGRTVTVPLVLSSSTADGDHDGVPDAIDDCPGVANPDQANARGAGPGDACATMDALPPGSDLAPSPVCPVAGAVLCEDWQVPYPTNKHWRPQASVAPNVTFTSDTSHMSHGTPSLHIHVDPITTSTSYVQADLRSGNLTGGTMWVRAYIYLPSATPPTDATLLIMSDTAHNFGAWYLSNYQGPNIGFTDDIASPKVELTSATQFPTDRWFCLEWQIVQVATAGMSSSRLYLDGSEVTDIASPNDTANPGDFSQLSLSATFNGTLNQPAGTDVWFNAIVVAPARVGCLP